MTDIFVSYTSSDRDWAFWIGHELIALDHTPRIHEWEIPGGGDIPAWMEERHHAAGHILCIVSHTYLDRPYSSWERRAAQWAAATDRPNFALPVFIEACEAPTLFAHLKRCDLYGLSEDDARARLKAFLSPVGIPPRGAFPGRVNALSAPTQPRPRFPGTVALSNVPTTALPRLLGTRDIVVRRELEDRKKLYSVMLSSPYEELAEHRRAVREAMLGQRMLPIAMEDDSALPNQDLIEASLAKVDDSDAFVGLISCRYGQIPDCLERNPDQLSLSELEFRRAEIRGIPICMFMMHDDHPVSGRVLKRVREEGKTENEKFELFLRLAKKDRIYAEFKSVEDLKAKTVQSLVKLREVLDQRAYSCSSGTSEGVSHRPQEAPELPTKPVTSIEELRLAYDSTERSRWPCQGARVGDLNADLVKLFASKIAPQLVQDGVQGNQLAARLGLLSMIPTAGESLPHHAAILCFCDTPEQYFPQARASFVGGEQHEEHFVLERITGPLHRQIIRIIELTFSELRTRVSFDRDGRRIEIDEIPRDVVREAISNAIAHRDYRATSTVQVRVTNDFVEVINPGSFPPGCSWDSFLSTEAMSSPTDAAIAYYLTIQLSFEGIGRGFFVFRKYIEQNGKEAITCEVGPGPTVIVRIRRPQKVDATVAMKADQLPSSAAEQPSVSNIPISVPRHFMGRDDALAAIETALRGKGGRVAITTLHGMRGVGKTTLAAAYAERHRDKYRATWWIRAQTEATTRADLVGLGNQLGWVDDDDREEPAIQTVMERLREEGDGLLLIFDNAPDAGSISSYLPLRGGAHVLVTSNSDTWRGVAAPVEIRLWPKNIGADYLIARTGREREGETALALSEALGGLPLAHEQAAAYCERLGTSLDTYRKRFEAEPAQLLDADRDAPAEYHDRLTVAKTFALAIEEAGMLHPAAEPLIVHAALLAPEPIPLFLFAEGREQFGEPLATALAGDGLDEAVAALRVFALVERETIPDERDPAITTETIRLPRLVRQVAATRQDGEAREKMRRTLVLVMAKVFPRGVLNDPNTWSRVRRLDALALTLVGGDTAPPKGAEVQAAELLNGLAWYRHGALATYAQARPLYESALAIREKVLGPDHPDTAISLNNLALLLMDQGDLTGAQPLFERALAIHEKGLGPKHPGTSTILNNLGLLLRMQGNLAGARPLFERALAIAKEAFGEHPDTATSLNNLARLLRDQGDLAAARSLYEHALAIREKVLGPEHPQTAGSLNNLALLLEDQGSVAGARPLYERALAICEKTLGPEHPATARSLNNLGLLLKDQGDLAAARPLLERALAIREKVLGPEHADTKGSARGAADLLDALGRTDEVAALRARYGIEPDGQGE